MKAMTHQGKIVTLYHWHYCSLHLQIMRTLQREVPNLPLETEPTHPGIRNFIPIHALNLENNILLSSLNAP